jgi:hypothetical protein
MRTAPLRIAVALLVPLCVAGPMASQQSNAELAGLVKAYLGMSHPADWDGVATLPGITWAPPPVTSLKNCLPNGDCFAWEGRAVLDGRPMTVVATGARTMVLNLLIRNTAAPLGAPAILAALERAGFSTEPVRCPIKDGTGGTTWHRLTGAGVSPGHLSIQPAAAGRKSEGYMLSARDELPALQPNQLALYSEQCAPGAARTPVSTVRPHESLAQEVVALLVPSSSPAPYDWKTLAALPTGIAWTGDGPKPMDLSFKNDPNPVAQSGSVAYGGRTFSVLASGTPTQVKTVHLEELGTHPTGEHMLGVVYEKGIAVKLVRCGPVYTESTNNWYSLTSAKTRPAMVRQSIHYDGKLVSDTYELRLDGSLPPRDPRDRTPGSNGC